MKIHKSVKIAWNAHIEGKLKIGKNSSIWYGASVRADSDKISIGKGVNIQDCAVVHVDNGAPCKIGDFTTIGHGAIIHSCQIGKNCVIGMGAIILNGAKIGDNSIVGAGALVTQNKEFAAGSLIMGSPASAKRTLNADEIKANKINAKHYIKASKNIRF